MTGDPSRTAELTRRLLDFTFRFRVPLTWIVAIVAFAAARPTTISILVGAAVAAIGLGWRAWAAGTIRKNAEMATNGPYALSRHPLYFGNLVLAFGFAAAAGRLWMPAAIVALAAAVYIPLIRSEEQALIVLFGERYRQYMRGVPCLFPGRAIPAGADPKGGFSWRRYWANHEYNAAIGYSAAVIVLIALRWWHPHG